MEGDPRQKLLSTEKPSASASASSSEEEDEEVELSLVNRVWKESKKIWVVAAPAISTRCSTYGIQVISQAFIGHIGAKELAGFALVFTVLVRFGNGILVCFFF